VGGVIGDAGATLAVVGAFRQRPLAAPETGGSGGGPPAAATEVFFFLCGGGGFADSVEIAF
jgi:hypothetical protein